MVTPVCAFEVLQGSQTQGELDSLNNNTPSVYLNHPVEAAFQKRWVIMQLPNIPEQMLSRSLSFHQGLILTHRDEDYNPKCSFGQMDAHNQN